MPTVAVLSVGNTAHGIVDLIILLGLVFLDFYAVTKTDHLLPALRYPARDRGARLRLVWHVGCRPIPVGN